jgi:putative hydrolase of the HAD superfamily
MIKAIIFDFGRVISAQKPMSLFRRYEEELGLSPGMLNRVMFGSRAWEEVLVGRKTLEQYWQEIGPALELRTSKEVEVFRQRYREDEAMNEGVVAMIRQLKVRYKLAVLSNSPSGLARWLEDWDILDLFDVVFCSGDEGVAKPDPAAFHRVLSRLGVEPAEALFIDDSLRHVKAARALGLRGIHFTTAEALVEELGEVLDL